jgi:hypothetical protein
MPTRCRAQQHCLVSEHADCIDQKFAYFSYDAFKLRQTPQRNIVGNNFARTNKASVVDRSYVPANAENAILAASSAGAVIPTSQRMSRSVQLLRTCSSVQMVPAAQLKSFQLERWLPSSRPMALERTIWEDLRGSVRFLRVRKRSSFATRATCESPRRSGNELTGERHASCLQVHALGRDPTPCLSPTLQVPRALPTNR